MSELTAARVRELLDCDPATGVLTWRAPCGNNSIPAGSVAGTVRPDGYRQVSIGGRLYMAHRLVWLYIKGEWPPGQLDHIDTCPGHDWIDNLRPATHTQNQQNKRRYRNNQSGFKGVSFVEQRRKWQASIKIKGQLQHLGYFDSPEAAHAAYAEQAKQHFGEFARCV